MKNQMKRLTDVFPDWIIGSGIFSELHKFDVPWKNKFESAPLDLAYFGNNSGDKLISPLVEKLLVNDELPEENLTKLAQSIYTLNIDNWSRLWSALQEEYDPLQNYNGDETRTVTNKLTGTDTIASSGADTVSSTLSNSNVKTGSVNLENSGADSVASSGTDSLSHNDSSSETISGSKTEDSNADSGLYGFNSSSSVPSNVNNQTVTTNYNDVKTSRTSTSSDSTNYGKTDKTSYGKTEKTSFENVTDSQSGQNSTETTYGKTDTNTKDLTTTITDEFHREGNLGITSSQQMLKQELELRENYYFFGIVFKDLDKSLSLLIY